MKVLLQGRYDLLRRIGGDSVLIQNLHVQLSQHRIYCQINTTEKINFSKFDIIHLFGIMRIHDLYPYFLQAKKYHKKIIVTPIYEDLNLLDNYGRVGWEGFFANILLNDLKELGKGFLRAVKDKKQFKSAFLQSLVPYSKQQKNLLLSANNIIATSHGEMNNLIKNFCLSKSKVSIIPICINEDGRQVSKNLFVNKYGLTNFILSVGRIEPKKNQLGLIKALKDTKVPIVFVGNLSQYHKSYATEFLKQVQRNSYIKYVGALERNMLLSAYKAAKVHVLPSWFEVLGITNLEAGISGCNVVTTSNGYAKEYFGDLAWYCNPEDESSIKHAIEKAYNSPVNNELKNIISEKYTCKNMIPRILQVYKKVLRQ